MPAELDVDREAVKAHAITHGLRRAAEHFGLRVSTVGSWSERDPNGPWCPKDASKLQVLRPPTVLQRANSANNASVAARTAMQKLGDKSKLHLAKAVAKGAKTASKLPGELILAGASNLKALADTGDKLHQWSGTSNVPTLRLELIANAMASSEELPAIDVIAQVTREGSDSPA